VRPNWFQTPARIATDVIGVDPSGTKGDGGDYIGIIVAGIGVDGLAYVIEDCSVRAGPAKWGHVVVNAFERHRADRVVAEVNFGGALVHEVVHGAASAVQWVTIGGFMCLRPQFWARRRRSA
jgi:phage terminase large subunit-like protein